MKWQSGELVLYIKKKDWRNDLIGYGEGIVWKLLLYSLFLKTTPNSFLYVYSVVTDFALQKWRLTRSELHLALAENKERKRRTSSVWNRRQNVCRLLDGNWATAGVWCWAGPGGNRQSGHADSLDILRDTFVIFVAYHDRVYLAGSNLGNGGFTVETSSSFSS
jgi:hypothetical protein